VNHLVVKLPVAQDFVETVGGKVLDELSHTQLVELFTLKVVCSLGHLEVGQCPVAVEGDEFRAEASHDPVLN